MANEKKDNKEKNESKELEVVEEVGLQNNEGIRIANEVISVIAGKAATEVPGVFSMAGGLGISEVFGKKNMSKGIKVEAGEKETRIDVHIIVDYGVRIPDIAYEIQNRVKKAVETMTGLKVVEVNVHVQGVNVIDKDGNQEYLD